MISKILKMIEENYSLKNISYIKATEFGSGNTFIVSAENSKYIAKINERPDYVLVYNTVQQVLTENEINSSKIITTDSGSLLVNNHFALYSYVQGETFDELNDTQITNAIKYLKSYNEIIRGIPFTNDKIECKNNWDIAKSLTFIIYEFEDKHLNDSNLPIQQKIIINSAINIIKESFLLLDNQHCQLIHSDLGADNFLFHQNEVVSIIDFTPDYKNHIYSLCQFTYWNALWRDLTVTKDDITKKIFMPYGTQIKYQDVFYLMLLQAALYRFIAPFIDMCNRQCQDFSVLDKRIQIIDKVMRMVIM